jgi:nucleoside-diphosphate kinase
MLPILFASALVAAAGRAPAPRLAGGPAAALRLRSGESTFAMLKPDVASDEHAVDEIKARIAEAGLAIERERRCTLSEDLCERFYEEHRARPFYGALVEFMSSGPVVMFELSGEDAIAAWRALIGPTNTAVARQDAPRSIRALYGTDGTRNAAHGADSPTSVARELALMFDRRLQLLRCGAVVVAAISCTVAALAATGRLPGAKVSLPRSPK